MLPVRGSIVWVRTTAATGCVVRFSRIATCPVLRQPNAATARSILPSPLKSAASTLATRGQPSSQNAPYLPFAEAAQPDRGALGVIGREELAHVGDEQIRHAVLVDVGRG